MQNLREDLKNCVKEVNILIMKMDSLTKEVKMVKEENIELRVEDGLLNEELRI